MTNEEDVKFAKDPSETAPQPASTDFAPGQNGNTLDAGAAELEADRPPVENAPRLDAAAASRTVETTRAGPVQTLEAELQAMERTLDSAKTDGAATLSATIAAVERHANALRSTLERLRNTVPSSARAERFARWDQTARRTTTRVRKGAAEFGVGVGNAWRELSAATRKAWTELRSEDGKPPVKSLEDKRGDGR